MRIVSWNCKCGFDRDKPKIINKLNADILVILECREMDMADMDKFGFDDAHRKWYGDHKEVENEKVKKKLEVINKTKDLGIGVFWRDGITIEPLPIWENSLKENCDFRYLVPYKVERNFDTFTLIAVWTKDKGITGENDRLDYTLKARAAIEHYGNIDLLKSKVIFIGDFNTGSIRGARNSIRYEDLARAFGKKDFKNCADGQEWVPTFFKGFKSWLDDHCFASNDFEVISFGIGNSDYWRKYSDHCPIIVDFNF